MTEIKYNSSYAIYLDIDGVLNSDKTMSKTPKRFIGISSDKVKLLREIIKATGANIILSSSWRKMNPTDLDYKYLIKQLKYKGLYIKDKTIISGSGNRGFEIQEHLQKHPEITNYVILDDEFEKQFIEFGLEEHYVHTNFRLGLTKNDVKKAIAILKGEYNFYNCKFSEDEIKHIISSLQLCEDRELFIQEETYIHNYRLIKKLKTYIENQDEDSHFGRDL